jgi:hypothetical protein
VGSAIPSVVSRKKAILRHSKPFGPIPGAPVPVVIKEGPRRPAVGIVAAADLGVQRRVPVLIDVVHLCVAITMLAGLRKSGKSTGMQTSSDENSSSDEVEFCGHVDNIGVDGRSTFPIARLREVEPFAFASRTGKQWSNV